MVSKGRKRDGRIQRRPPQREPRRRILIICEGRRTEPEYFRALTNDIRNPRVQVRVVGPGGAPLQVVRQAIEEQEIATRRAAAEHDENLKWDEVWAVFDVDEHPGIEEAQQEAQSVGVRVALSNPCFELWALLHFEDHRAHITRHDLIVRLRTHLPRYEKVLDYEALKLTYEEAVARARALDERASRAGKRGANPHTGIPDLTESMRSS